MRDLFGKIQPDDFSRSIPLDRPMMPVKTSRENSLHAMPREREIEIRDNARVLCKVDRHGYLEGSRIKRKGGAVAGSTSPGRDAMLGWGDVARVNGIVALTKHETVKGPEVVTRDITKLGSTIPDYEGA